jgi:SSS family solute:Na+ symporter
MTRHFTTLDWAVLAVYFMATIGIGLFFSRKSQSAEGFTAANRSLPGWVCGLSIFATFLSSISFLALPGKSFATNWTPFAFSLSLPLATWIAVRWFLPYYRRSGEVSAYAHLEKRFGPWARLYAGTFYLLTQFARAGMVLYLMALPVSIIMGVPIGSVLIVTGIIVTGYAFLGGIVAVIWTDALQAVVLIAGAVICLLVILLDLRDGPGGLFGTATEHGKFSLGDMDMTALGRQTFWVVLLNGLFINLQNFGIDQSYVQRYIASSSEREARRGVWLGGLLYVPVSAVFFLIGTGLFAYYQCRPGDIAEVRTTAAAQQVLREGIAASDPAFDSAVAARADTLEDAKIADSVFPHFIGKHLPAGLTGLIIAAVLAAGMSTVSTSLNSSATILHSDFFLRFLRPGASDAASLAFLRLATLAVGIIGTGVSFLLLNVSSALDAWWTLSSVFSGGILGLFLLGMISRARNAAAIIGVVAGLLVIAWMVLSALPLWPASLARLASPFHGFLVIVFGTLTILFTGIALTLFGGTKSKTS